MTLLNMDPFPINGPTERKLTLSNGSLSDLSWNWVLLQALLQHLSLGLLIRLGWLELWTFAPHNHWNGLGGKGG